jgi:hypothetical protein
VRRRQCLRVTYGVDFRLVATAAACGVLGALAALLLTGERKKETKHWVTTLLLGLFSGLLTVLIVAFDILDVLAAIPGASALGRILLSDFLGIGLVAFVGGFAFRAILGRFATDTKEPRKKKPENRESAPPSRGTC